MTESDGSVERDLPAPGGPTPGKPRRRGERLGAPGTGEAPGELAEDTSPQLDGVTGTQLVSSNAPVGASPDSDQAKIRERIGNDEELATPKSDVLFDRIQLDWSERFRLIVELGRSKGPVATGAGILLTLTAAAIPTGVVGYLLSSVVSPFDLAVSVIGTYGLSILLCVYAIWIFTQNSTEE